MSRLAGLPIDNVAVDPTQPIGRGCATLVDAETWVLSVAGVQVHSDEHEWPYGPPQPDQSVEPIKLTLAPYYTWSNRSDDAMRVWIPRMDGGQLRSV